MFVSRRGWHIDVGFAADELGELQSVRDELPSARFISFGFGDRYYLLHRNASFPGVFAALWPGRGLVLITALQDAPQRAFGAKNVAAVRISAAQARALQQFIRASLQTPAQKVADGPYPDAAFLASTVSYSAINTCNTWAAKALAAAGLPVSSRGVVFAGQLWRQVQRIAAVQNAELTGRAAWYRPGKPRLSSYPAAPLP